MAEEKQWKDERITCNGTSMGQRSEEIFSLRTPPYKATIDSILQHKSKIEKRNIECESGSKNRQIFEE